VLFLALRSLKVFGALHRHGRVGGREEKKNQHLTKRSAFRVLIHSLETFSQIFTFGEVSRCSLPLRRGIFIPPLHTLGSLSGYSAPTSDLILFHWSSADGNFRCGRNVEPDTLEVQVLFVEIQHQTLSTKCTT